MAEHFYYSIASGSSGNCGLYVSDGTAVLIDVGVSLRKLTAALAAFDMKPGELDALIITHEHIDHVKGLAMFLKKTEVPVFASRGTAAALTAKEPGIRGAADRVRERRRLLRGGDHGPLVRYAA